MNNMELLGRIKSENVKLTDSVPSAVKDELAFTSMPQHGFIVWFIYLANIKKYFT
jgi:hypothetical protein